MASGLFSAGPLASSPGFKNSHAHHDAGQDSNSRPPSRASNHSLTSTLDEDVSKDFNHVKELLSLAGPQAGPGGVAQHLFPRGFRANINHAHVLKELDVLKKNVLQRIDEGSVSEFNDDSADHDSPIASHKSTLIALHESQQQTARLQDLLQEHESSLNQAKQQIKDLESDFQLQQIQYDQSLEVKEEQVKAATGTNDSATASRERALQDLREKHQAHLNDTRNELSTELEAKNGQAERVLEKHGEQLKEQENIFQSRLSERDGLMQLRQRQHDQHLKELETAHQQELESNKLRFQDVDRRQDQKREAVEKENADLRARIKELEDCLAKEIDGHAAARKEAEADLANHMQRSHEQANGLSEQVSQITEEMKRSKESHQQTLTDRETSHASEVASIKKQLEDINNEHERSREKSETQRRQMAADHADTIEGLKLCHGHEKRELESRLDQQSENHRQSVERLEEEHSRLTESLKSHHTQHRDEFEQSMERTIAEQDSIIKQKDQTHAVTMEQLEARHANEKRELGDRMKQRSDEYNHTVKQLGMEHASKFEEAKTQHEIKKQELGHRFQTQAHDHEQRVSQMKKDHTHQLKVWEESVLRDLETIRERHEQKIQVLQREHEAGKRLSDVSWSQRLTELEQDWRRKLEVAHSEHRESLSTQKDQSEKALEESQRSHRSNVAAVESKLKDAREAYNTALDDLKKAHSTELGDKLQNADRAHATSLRDIERKMDASLDDARKAHEHEMQAGLEEAHRSFQSKLDESRQDHAARMQAEREQHELELRKMKAAHDEERKNLTADQDAAVQQLSSQYAEEKESTIRENEKSKNMYERKLDELTTSKNQLIQDLRRQLEASAEESQKIKEEIEANLEQKISGVKSQHEGRVAEIQHVADMKIKEQDEANARSLTQRAQKHEQQMTALRQALETDKRELQQGHLAELDNLKKQYSKSISELEEYHGKALTNLHQSHATTLSSTEKDHEKALEARTKDITESTKAECQKTHSVELDNIKRSFSETSSQREHEIRRVLNDEYASEMKQYEDTMNSLQADKERLANETGAKEAQKGFETHMAHMRHEHTNKMAQKDREIDDLASQIERLRERPGSGSINNSAGNTTELEQVKKKLQKLKDESRIGEKQRCAIIDETSALKRKLGEARTKQLEAERMRDALLSRDLRMPKDPPDRQRPTSVTLPREDGYATRDSEYTPMNRQSRSSEEPRSNVQPRSEPTNPLRARYDRARASFRGLRGSSRPPSSKLDENADLERAQHRLRGEYKAKLDEILRSKASLEENFTARYMHELASAKAELVKQFNQSIAEISRGPPLMDSQYAKTRHVEDLQRTESRLQYEHEERAASMKDIFRPETEGFDDIVNEYDQKVTAILGEGGSITNDLSIRPEHFEQLASERGRRSIENTRSSKSPKTRSSHSYSAGESPHVPGKDVEHDSQASPAANALPQKATDQKWSPKARDFTSSKDFAMTNGDAARARVGQRRETNPLTRLRKSSAERNAERFGGRGSKRPENTGNRVGGSGGHRRNVSENYTRSSYDQSRPSDESKQARPAYRADRGGGSNGAGRMQHQLEGSKWASPQQGKRGRGSSLAERQSRAIHLFS